MTTAVRAFRDYANAPKIRVYVHAANWFRDLSKNAAGLDQLTEVEGGGVEARSKSSLFPTGAI